MLTPATERAGRQRAPAPSSMPAQPAATGWAFGRSSNYLMSPLPKRLPGDRANKQIRRPRASGTQGKRMKPLGSRFRGKRRNKNSGRTRIAGIRDPGLTLRGERYPIAPNASAGTKNGG